MPRGAVALTIAVACGAAPVPDDRCATSLLTILRSLRI